MSCSPRLRRFYGGTVTAGLLLLISTTFAPSVHADYTLTPNKADSRGVWEGWGCSICWWGNGVGNSAYQNLYADLFFTQKTVPFLGKPLPGLGMNIVRYNVGGSGMGDNIGGTTENLPANYPWYRDINGYWVNWYNSDPSSNSWDWYRDSNQRNVLWAARDRGVNHIEFFANAPMWWMTYEKSSAGGSLQWWNRRDFMRYMATVVKYARDNWGLDVSSVEAFNEPSAGWWTYPHDQEGCNIGGEQQAEILGYLREELSSRGLNTVAITASDENSMTQARSTYDWFKGKTVSVNGTSKTVDSLIDKVNVHGYNGLSPWRDNSARQQLRQSVGQKRLWMSEYGDPDGSGMSLAQTIMEDLNYLRPSAWIYWQPVEPYSGWGFVNGNYANTPTGADRAKPTWIYYKYYVMAQFSRYLRPGFRIIGSNDNNSVLAYNDRTHDLVIITVNYGNAQQIDYDLTGLQKVGRLAYGAVTNTNGSRLLSKFVLPVQNKHVRFQAAANSVRSLTISNVVL